MSSFSLKVYSNFVESLSLSALPIFLLFYFFRATTRPPLVERHFSCKCNHRTMKAAYNNCPALSDIASCRCCCCAPSSFQPAPAPSATRLWQPLRAFIFAWHHVWVLCECNRIRSRPTGSITIFSLYFCIP